MSLIHKKLYLSLLILIQGLSVFADDEVQYDFDIEVIIEQGGSSSTPQGRSSCYEQIIRPIRENASQEEYERAFAALLQCQTPCLSARDARFLAECDLHSMKGCPDQSIEDALEMGYFENLVWDRHKGLSCNTIESSVEMPEIPSQVRREARQVHPICSTDNWRPQEGGYWVGPQGDRIYIGLYSRESFCDLIHHRFGWSIEAYSSHLHNTTSNGVGGGVGISFIKLGEIESYSTSRNISLIEAEARLSFFNNRPVTVGAVVGLSALYLSRLSGRNAPAPARCTWVAGGGGGAEYFHLNRNTAESQVYARGTTGLLCHTRGETRRSSFLVSGVFDMGIGGASEQETGSALGSPRGVTRVRSGVMSRLAIGNRLWVASTVLQTHEFWRNASESERDQVERERPYWSVDVDVRLDIARGAPEQNLARRPYLIYQFDWANDSGSIPSRRPSTPVIVNQLGLGVHF